MSEQEKKQKMSEWFTPDEPNLKRLRVHCNKVMFELNQLDNSQKQKRYDLLKGLLGHMGEDVNIKSYFQCDYGINIFAGNHVFVNYNCVFVDVGKIIIGDHTFIGPQVGIYTVNHPLDPAMREQGLQRSCDVKIGRNCWIGGNATINPGVILGDNVVVASGAVVTKSFGNDIMIAGVPARILKKI